MVYCCCFLDANDTIDVLEEIEASSLLAAIEQTNAMLKERPQHAAAELWQDNGLDNRCAYRAHRDRAAA
jgi:hypothetical protein